MTDLNYSLRLPLDPFLHNASDWWWKNNRELHDHPDKIYSAYQEWMRVQGVVIRSPNTTEDGVFFNDEQSMLMFILRWSN